MACGYMGHVCSIGTVHFMSRYRFENDYCVDGARIGIHDDGTVKWHGHTPSQEILDRILIFELERYAEYLRQRTRDSLLAFGALQPFTHPVIRVC
jgi:hypothetical protein